ncbi:MAG: acyltransferase, partial [Rhodospirillales bacterium]|nr:acyltransferase [Rhodospirillales bacterium]
MVVLYHATFTSHLLHLPIVTHGYLFVDFFFVLSGFVITHAYAKRLESTDDVLAFLIRRFGRVWPLHAATLLAMIAVAALAAALLPAGLRTHLVEPFIAKWQPDTVPAVLLMLNGVGKLDAHFWNWPSWSIGSEFYTYALFAVVCVAARGRALVPALALAIGGLLGLITLARWNMDVTYDFGLFRCVYGFFCGHLLHR